MIQFSAVAADPYGGSHAFWVHAINSDEPANVIFYSFIDSQGYSLPNDILMGQDGDLFSLPQAYGDHTGRIHLVWSGLQGVYYSVANASQTLNVKQWADPYLIARAEAVGSIDVTVDSDERVHVVYSLRRAGSNVMYVRSEDGGGTWTDPVPLSTIVQVGEQAPDSARIAQDGRSGLHVVWAENYPPAYIGRQVLYVRSVDGGLTWTSPYALCDRSGEEAWNALPEIVADSEDRIHVMWAGCGSPVSRCYRASPDRGARWLEISSPFPTMVGSSGRDAMVSDSYGGIHWFGALREPQALYFGRLQAGTWPNPPERVVSVDEHAQLGMGHWPSMAVASGNRLDILVVEVDGGPLWYLQGTTDLPEISAVPLTTISTPAPTPSPIAALTLSTGMAVPAGNAVSKSSATRPSAGLPLAIGAAAALCVAVAAVVYGRKARSR